MTWLKLDDKMYMNPKIHALSLSGFRMHIGGLLYCCQQLTDGLVSVPAVYALYTPGMDPVESVTEELVSRSLWVEVDEGWLINDYLEYNPSRSSVLGKRASETARKQRQRAKGQAPPVPADAPTSVPPGRDVRVIDPVPDPTRSPNTNPQPQAAVPPGRDLAVIRGGGGDASEGKLGAVAINGVVGVAIHVTELGKLIRKRAKKIGSDPCDVAEWLNANLHNEPPPEPLKNPIGLMRFRLAKIEGPVERHRSLTRADILARQDNNAGLRAAGEL